MPTHGNLGFLMTTSATRDPLDVEAHLGDFTDLLATSITKVEIRSELAQLVEEQGALRRIATSVAHGAPPVEVFTAVTREVSQLLRIQCVLLGRYDPDGSVTFVAISGGNGASPVGSHLKLGGDDVATLVATTGRSARMDHYSNGTGAIVLATVNRWPSRRNAGRRRGPPLGRDNRPT